MALFDRPVPAAFGAALGCPDRPGSPDWRLGGRGPGSSWKFGAARAHRASKALRSSPQLQHERRFTLRWSQNDTRRVILPTYLLRMALPLGLYSLLEQATTDLDTSGHSSLQYPRTQISTDIPSIPSYLTLNSRFNYVLVLGRVAPTSPLPCRSNEPPEDGRNAASAILNTTRSAWRRSR